MKTVGFYLIIFGIFVSGVWNVLQLIIWSKVNGALPEDRKVPFMQAGFRHRELMIMHRQLYPESKLQRLAMFFNLVGFVVSCIGLAVLLWGLVGT